MKNTVKALSLAGLLGLALSVQAGAAPEGDGGGRKGPGPEGRRGPPPELIKQFDKDGDGKLNDDERKAMHDAMEAKADTNGDGTVSDEERKAFREKRMEEMKKRREEHGGDAGPGPGPKPGEGREAFRKKLLEQFDANGDGKLDDEEKAKAQEARKNRKPKDGAGDQ